MKNFFIYNCFRCENYYPSQINHECEQKRPKTSIIYSGTSFFPFYSHGPKKNEMMKLCWNNNINCYQLLHYRIMQGKLYTDGITLFPRAYSVSEVWQKAILYSFFSRKKDKVRYVVLEFTLKEKNNDILHKYVSLPQELYQLISDYQGKYTSKTYNLKDTASFMKNDQWVVLYSYRRRRKHLEIQLFNYVTRKEFKYSFPWKLYRIPVDVQVLLFQNTPLSKEYVLIFDHSSTSIFTLFATFSKTEMNWVITSKVEEIIVPVNIQRPVYTLDCYSEKPIFKLATETEDYLVKLQRNAITNVLELIILHKFDVMDERRDLLLFYHNQESI